MPRLPRIYIEGILYYVTSRGGHNQTIFIEPADYQEYISLIAKYKQQYGFKLFSYVLLPTSLHMLIEVRNNVGISSIMHDINSLYTKIFNGRYNRRGHLFQGRFKASLVEKEKYLLRLARYINLCPKILKMVDDPKDYAHSSYLQFLDPLRRQYPNIQEEVEECFSLLGGREQAFKEYIFSIDQKQISDFGAVLRKKRILGSRIFNNEMKKAIEEAAKQQAKPPLSKRVRVIYMAVTSAAILILLIAISFSYRQSTKLKSQQQETFELYKKTLATLEQEKDKAIKVKKDIEYYEWKISLTEKALEDLKKERVKTTKEKTRIEGYTWTIKLRQIGGPKATFAEIDVIFFDNKRVNTVNLREEGFPNVNYTKTKLANGNVIWETMQTKSKSEIVSWKGEWNGRVMRGVLSKRFHDGTVRDFSFESVSRRAKR